MLVLLLLLLWLHLGMYHCPAPHGPDFTSLCLYAPVAFPHRDHGREAPGGSTLPGYAEFPFRFSQALEQICNIPGRREGPHYHSKISKEH
jgi:hypothetical protein